MITGSISTLDYGTVTIRNGKLDQGKTSGSGVSVSSNGRLSMTIVFKVDTIQPSFAGAATNAVLANMYQDTAVAYAGLAIAGASENYPWMQLYAQAAYEYAEDAYLQAFAALDQSSTFWGTYAVQYANYDLTNRLQALGAIKSAAKKATEGDLQRAAYLTGLGIASGAAADLYNGTTIWCSSMEHGISQ